MGPWLKQFEDWLAREGNLNTFLKFVAFLIFLMIMLAALAKLALDRPEKSPCMVSGMPARCYRVSEKMCQLTWQNAQATCMEVVRKMKLLLGRPRGPTLDQCAYAVFDRAFKTVRKNDSECLEKAATAEGWARLNLDSQ